MDEYCRWCIPQGTKGSGGDVTRGDTSTGGGLGGTGAGINRGGSKIGGDGTLGTTGGAGIVTGADSGASGMMIVGPLVPPVPEGPRLGMKMGDGNLFLIVLL